MRQVGGEVFRAFVVSFAAHVSAPGCGHYIASGMREGQTEHLNPQGRDIILPISQVSATDERPVRKR